MSGQAPDVLLAALSRLDRRLQLEIARLRARDQLSLDEFRGLYISDEQVDRVVTIRSPSIEILQVDDRPMSADLTRDPKWDHVQRTFRLSSLDLDLLLIAMAPEVDLRYETLFAYLNNDVSRKWPTADLAARLIGGTSGIRPAIAGALSPASTLRRERLLVPIDPPAARPSLLNSGFAVQAALSRFLQGAPVVPIDRGGDDLASGDGWRSPSLTPEQVDRLQRVGNLMMSRNGDSPALVIVGPPGSGRMEAARVVAAFVGLPLRRIDFHEVRRSGLAAAAAIAEAALELRLERTTLCVSGLDALSGIDGRWPADMRGLLADLDRVSVPLVLVVDPNTAWSELLGRRRAHLVELGIPDYGGRLVLWRRCLDDAGLAVGDVDSRELAARFVFTPAQIAGAVATAVDWLAMGQASSVDGALVRDAARAQPRQRLGSLAVIVSTRHGWNDLVLPPGVLVRLKEIAAAIRCRHVVYADWAFGRRMAAGLGVKALFSGPSGTGKTMAAGVIARELGLDLVKVDLSGVVSKYIGETEKNLEQVFAGARAGNSLLFFDEADAIFGKRSEVKDAHDRYANVEVAYLLQRLDDHDGVVVLASNLRRNIDDAFSRRMHYVVDFPQPDADARERLWRGMFPSEAPIGGDVDLPFLAQQFELAGGDIRNVALDAAFLAADTGGPITMRHIVRAMARHQAKMGRTPSMADFQRYFGLLEAGQSSTTAAQGLAAASHRARRSYREA